MNGATIVQTAYQLMLGEHVPALDLREHLTTRHPATDLMTGVTTWHFVRNYKLVA